MTAPNAVPAVTADAEGARLVGRLAELAAGLAQLIADLGEHRDQLRQQSDRAGLAALPTGDQLASPLLALRRALKAGRP